MKTLSKQFSEAQYFATHRVVGLQAWARARNGSLLRAYKYLGESGEVLWVHGRTTPEEQALGVILQDVTGPVVDEGRPPDEEDVLNLAGHWSIDLTRIALDDVRNRGGALGRL